MLRGIALVMMMAFALLAQAPRDPADSVLVAYALTPDQEALFSHTDGVISAFWSEWDGSRDYIALRPPVHCWPERCSFTDTADAFVVVRAAASPMGLYLWVRATDDSWLQSPTYQLSAPHDLVTMLVAEESAEAIDTCSDCLIGLYASAISYTTSIVSVSMGQPAAAGHIYLQYYDNLQRWGTESYAPAGVWALYGIAFEQTESGAWTRELEMMLPWRFVGRGFEEGTVLSRKRIAFTIGYDDADSAYQSDAALWWMRGSPEHDAQGVPMGYWGDLLTADDVPAAGPWQGVRQPTPAASWRGRTGPGGRALSMYDLRGRRLHAEDVWSRQSVQVLVQSGWAANRVRLVGTDGP